MTSTNGWHQVPLVEVATPVQRNVAVIPGNSYRTLGVKWWGQGAYARDTIDGSQTAAATLSEVRIDDLIINKIWVRHGSVAIVGPEVHGCVGSNEFPTFELNYDRVLPRWLHWYTKTQELWKKCEALSRGTSGKNRIRAELFLSIPIPLPPLAEQRRIVAKIDRLAARIDEARSLKRIVTERQIDAYRNASFREAFAGYHIESEPSANSLSAHFSPVSAAEKPIHVPSHWHWARLSDLAHVITDGTHQTPLYLEHGIPFLSAQNVKPYKFMPSHHKFVSEDLYRSCIARGKPEMGDVLMTRVGAMIGEAAVIDVQVDFAYYVSLSLIKPRHDLICSEYLVHWLNSEFGTCSSKRHTLGQGHSQGNLNLNRIRQFVIPLPPLAEQRHIVASLNALQGKVDQTKQLQAKSAAVLDALLPSILDRAFKGGL